MENLDERGMRKMLSPRQEKFCLEYAASGNATEAYLKAGYSEKKRSSQAAASSLLKQPKIIERLKAIAEDIKREKIADVIECQEILTSIARNEKTADADRIKAINILMKVQGAYIMKLSFSSTPIVIGGGEQLED